MSEQWWFLMPSGAYQMPRAFSTADEALDASLYRGGGLVIHGRIVEDGEPCVDGLTIDQQLVVLDYLLRRYRSAAWSRDAFLAGILKIAEPCEWELSPFGEQGGKPNTKTWLNFISDFGYNFCPMCGRSLQEVPCTNHDPS